MKRYFAFVLFLFLSLSIFASITVKDDLFKSDEELKNFKVKAVTKDEEEYYSSMNIYLLTGGEGSLIWENFGHSAFVVTTPNGIDVAFDYGIFTFDENFLPSFILGELYYEVWETYALYRISSLEDEDRTVSLLPLNLTNNEKKAMYSFLLYNTKEENKTYLYDYFSDNCATRLRDIYSYAKGDDFYSFLQKESNETIRYSVNKHLSRSTFFVSWAINYLLGPSVDKKATLWDMCYLPSALEKAIKDYQGNESTTIYETKERKATPEKWNIDFYSLLFGLVLLSLSLLAYYKKFNKVNDLLLAIVLLLFGVMSLVLLFLSLFTIHYVTHSNLNIFIISPLVLISSFFHFASLRKERKEKQIAIVNTVMLIILILTVLVRLLFSSLLIQNIWAPTIVGFFLYAAEALPYMIKKKLINR